MKIRRAVVEDARAIAQAHIKSWQETYAGLVDADYLKKMNTAEKTAHWEDKLKRGEDIVFVLENDDGEIVGLASGGRHRDTLKQAEAELYAIYLLKDYQGGGWGRDLFEHMRHELRAMRFKAMSAWALEGNPAHKFYERMGGVKNSRQMLDIGGQDYPEIEYYWVSL